MMLFGPAHVRVRRTVDVRSGTSPHAAMSSHVLAGVTLPATGVRPSR